MTDKPSNDDSNSVLMASRRRFLKQSIVAASGIALGLACVDVAMAAVSWAAVAAASVRAACALSPRVCSRCSCCESSA